MRMNRNATANEITPITEIRKNPMGQFPSAPMAALVISGNENATTPPRPMVTAIARPRFITNQLPMVVCVATCPPKVLEKLSSTPNSTM